MNSCRFFFFLFNRYLEGEASELFIEIPPYRIPKFSVLSDKLSLRLSSFISGVVPLIMLGVAVIGILDFLGAMKLASNILGGPLVHILGLPPQTLSVIITGFLRKDVSIALLEPFNLSPKQLVIACIFLILYSPCISTFFIMTKELGIRNALKIVGIMLTISFSVEGLINLIFKIF